MTTWLPGMVHAFVLSITINIASIETDPVDCRTADTVLAAANYTRLVHQQTADSPYRLPRPRMRKYSHLAPRPG
ncbi:hypothetical protein OBBRIDRAFT_793360 [Obba rivulosa]|uniref:Secreted protein n=1 Tax=Obba rivulosa TaxID=1052685 RepID=A0A8E2B318_9APHY|nr:hypothetical protein OBBRIDRAFT_793360 [Obba rivulosa]